MLGSTAQLLRQSTADAHRRVEAGLDLLGPQLTGARLVDVLERFLGFWAVAEPRVAAWLAVEPEHAVALQAERRGRCAHLRRDLAALGRDVDLMPLAAPVFDHVDAAAALGWLYVSEGSTLGGAVIERRLGHPGIAFFTPYPEGPGPMWRAFIEHLEDWTGTDPWRTRDVVAAAGAVFDALAVWLEPVFVGVPA